MMIETLKGLRYAAIYGAYHLDHVKPGWWEPVDLELLDMGDDCYCVGAQSERFVDFEAFSDPSEIEDSERYVDPVTGRVGVFVDGNWEYFLTEMLGPLSSGSPELAREEIDWARRHGFWPQHDPIDVPNMTRFDQDPRWWESWQVHRREYEVLTRFWRRLVAVRQAS
jgi:hypothetical protein